MIEIREQTNEILANIMREQEMVSTIYTRIVIVSLSQMEHKSSDLAYALIHPYIKSCFNDPEGKVLRFSDNDVVIISRLATYKSYEAFCALLGNLSMIDQVLDVCKIYELPADALKIKNFMAEKSKTEKVWSTPAVKKVQEKAEFVELPIAPSLIASMATRRNSRAELVVQIIEDDVFSQRIAYNILRDKATVVASYMGQQAISNFVTYAPDIVFLDIGLPDIDGQKLLERLLQIDPAAHIVMLSGHGSRENILRAMKAGAKNFIAKPFNYQRVMETVKASPYIQSKQRKYGALHAGL